MKYGTKGFIAKGQGVYLTGEQMTVKIKPRWMLCFLWRKVRSWYPAKTQDVPCLIPADYDINAPIGIAVSLVSGFDEIYFDTLVRLYTGGSVGGDENE